MVAAPAGAAVTAQQGDGRSRSGSGSGHRAMPRAGVQPGLGGIVDMAAQGLGAADDGGGSKRQESGRENDMNSKRLPLLLLL